MANPDPHSLAATHTDTSFFGHPRGLATLFFTEMWERFSYYGMRAILILFMTHKIAEGGLGFGDEKAGAVYGLYTAMVYLLCLGGGWIADRITGFAGSMAFVYLHIIWFGCWIGFGVEKYPFGLLTMIVSLEAIFLSTFVMISQNRADAKRQVIADAQWKTVQEEDRQNEELLRLSRQILKLTQEVGSHGDAIEAERKQNEQLLAHSEMILDLTKAIHEITGARS